ncbi:MAG: heme exporter protein CcmB [Chromatiales bacterium]|nr:heme exporter protein CcmB [Chromatiales bacterium]
MIISKTVFALLKWDLLSVLRVRSDWLIAIIFFTIIVSLFPLAVDAQSSVLRIFAPAAIWVAALLSGLLSLERVFKEDFDNGVLEQLMLSTSNIYTIVLTRVFVHWCTTGLLFTLLAPIYGYALGIPTYALTNVIFGLLLGTPTLSALGALGAALTVSLRQGGMVSALLIMPFYVPLLIFGSNAIDLAANGLATNAPLAFLGAMLIMSLVLIPIAVYAALRIVLD